MNAQFTQLTLFDFYEGTKISYLFDGCLVDENLKYITKTVNGQKGIVQGSFRADLTQSEVNKLVSKAIKIERLNYGYKVFYKENEKYYYVYLRFFNNTTSKRETIFEFVNKNFKKEEQKREYQ